MSCLICSKKDKATALKGWPSTLDIHKSFSMSGGWDLARAKTACRSFGCTINDFTTAALAHAMALYNEEQRAAEGPTTKIKQANEMTMLSVANTRVVSAAAMDREIEKFKRGEAAVRGLVCDEGACMLGAVVVCPYECAAWSVQWRNKTGFIVPSVTSSSWFATVLKCSPVPLIILLGYHRPHI